jgi:hypothetical protein
MAGLFAIVSANGLLPGVIRIVGGLGWHLALLQTFGLSVIVWGAWAAACSFAWRADDQDHIGRLDVIVALIVLAMVMVPAAQLSLLTLAVLSAYVFLTSAKGSLLRRSAIIFFSICVPTLWGPLLLNFAAPTFLELDALMVGKLMGTAQTGNAVAFVHDDGGVAFHGLQVWPACSSFHNISQAGLAWVALSQALGRTLRKTDIFWCGLAVASAIAVNLTRLSLMAVSLDYFEMAHSPGSIQIAGALTIALIACICMIGQRHALFTRT